MLSWVTYPSIFTQPPKRSFNFFTLPRFPISWRVSKGNSKLIDCPAGIEPFTFSQTVSTWRWKKVGTPGVRSAIIQESATQLPWEFHVPSIYMAKKKMFPDFLKINLRQVTRMHSISLTYVYIHYTYTIRLYKLVYIYTSYSCLINVQNLKGSKITQYTPFKKKWNYHPLTVPTERVNCWNLRRCALELHAIFAFLFVLEAAIVSGLERWEETKDIGKTCYWW